MQNKWENIIIHCSDSSWGSCGEIRKWHLEKKWADVGYHFVINNGFIRPDFYIPIMDGMIEIGRPIDGDRIVSDKEVGAHALGYNQNSIGICLIGTDNFTDLQFDNLRQLVRYLALRFDIRKTRVIGHRDVDSKKTCPNFDVKSEVYW